MKLNFKKFFTKKKQGSKKELLQIEQLDNNTSIVRCPTRLISRTEFEQAVRELFPSRDFDWQ